MITKLTEAGRRIAREALAAPDDLSAIAQQTSIRESTLLDLVRAYLAEKAQTGPATAKTGVRNGAEIVRDKRGVPHIKADNPWDLFFGFGYAQAQDRLWQLDYLRRHAHGRLSEIFGGDRLTDDRLSRTLDISGIADRTVASLEDESTLAQEAFAAGINAWMAQLPHGLPAEFEWLGYEPEPWLARDSLAILRRWWWYLTGRLHVLWTPEVIRTHLDPKLFAAYYTPDAEVGYIVPPGAYDPKPKWPALPSDPNQIPAGGGEGGEGSNNWAVSPALSATGSALLASDPHVYYSVPADWYEARLEGAGYDVAGSAYPGGPGILFGRNRHLAWGVTNNICLQRDLYIEEFNPANASEYRHGNGWKAVEERPSTIVVKGAEPVEHVTRLAHGRPIIDHIVPPPAHPKWLWHADNANSSVSLAWVGFEPSDEPGSALRLNRAATVEEGRKAFEGWRLATWNMVLADDQGRIAYQCIGAIPLRERQWIGYRKANDPVDRWQDSIPLFELPSLVEPERGWIGSANNPTAPPDFPHPLAGSWTPEDRFPRLSKLIVERAPHDLGTFGAMQADVVTERGQRAIPGILAAIGTPEDPIQRAAADLLFSWDGELTIESASGSIYNVFFWRWHSHVVLQRFGSMVWPIAVESGNGLSAALLHENLAGWFKDDAARIAGIKSSFAEATDWLRERLGDDPSAWKWGDLHKLGAAHPAVRTPLQHSLFDIPPSPHQGGTSTLANAGFGLGGTFNTKMGASYRFITDLGSPESMRSITWPGQSGHPGSDHYADQVDSYLADEYFDAPLSATTLEAEATGRIRLVPAD